MDYRTTAMTRPKRSRPMLPRRAKKVRVERDPTTSLLSLSDDLLSRIFEVVQGGAQLRGRTLSDARHAFSLATTNTRLLDLFSASIRRIDALYPSSLELSPPLLSRECRPRHLRRLTLLAGDNLRVLRLPRYERGSPGVEVMLPVIAESCKQLEEIAFVDEGRVSRSWANALALPTLKRLEVCEPSLHLVEAMNSWTVLLESISLSGICSTCVPAVIEFLKRRGKMLRILKLQFDLFHDNLVEDSQSPALAQLGPRTILSKSLTPLALALGVHLPNLEEMNIAVLRDIELRQSMCSSIRRLPQVISHFEKAVTRCRLAQMHRKVHSKLRTLILKTFCRRSEDWLGPLAVLVNREVEVRVYIPGYALISPAAPPMNTRVLLSHFQLCNSVRNNGNMYGQWTSRLETLNLGDWHTILNHEQLRADFASLLKPAGENLTRVVGRFPIRSHEQCVVATSYVADVLELAPNVTSLEITQDIVTYADIEGPEITRLLRTFANLRKLYLHGPVERHSSDNFGFWSSEKICDFFTSKICAFLAMCLEKCPDLKVFYLERAGDLSCRDDARQRQRGLSLQFTICILSCFEALRPHVDASTVTNQLKIWFSQS